MAPHGMPFVSPGSTPRPTPSPAATTWTRWRAPPVASTAAGWVHSPASKPAGVRKQTRGLAGAAIRGHGWGGLGGLGTVESPCPSSCHGFDSWSLWMPLLPARTTAHHACTPRPLHSSPPPLPPPPHPLPFHHTPPTPPYPPHPPILSHPAPSHPYLQIGHLFRECTYTEREKPCHLCAQIGHEGRDCPARECAEVVAAMGWVWVG
jgi:hypothetical protein